MVLQVPQPDEAAKAADDLDTTAELPALDLTAYESQLMATDVSANPPGTAPEEVTTEERRVQPLPVLPAADTLRDIEAWIAEQDERKLSYERTLEEVQRARADAQARAENLTVELEVAQKALHTALCRANDGERAALDSNAAARAAETRATQLTGELETARIERTIAAQQITTVQGELTQTRDSLTQRAREHDQLQQRHADLERSHDARAQRITALEGERSGLSTQLDDLRRELNERATHLSAAHAATASQQAVTSEMVRERDALAARVATLTEHTQSRLWKRGFWESLWREMDGQLAHADALHRRIDGERGELSSRLSQLTTDLGQRDATIAQLKINNAGQVSALEELASTRAREMQEVRSIGETLATEFKALEQRHRATTETLASRERELSESHGARAAMQQSLDRLQSSEAASVGRINELEALAANLGRTLQTQTESAHRSAEGLSARERELADERTRASLLDAELQAAMRMVTDQAEKLRASDTALGSRDSQLQTAQERVAVSERERTQLSAQLADLHAQLGQTIAQLEEVHAARTTLAEDLGRAQSDLQTHTERVGTLEAAQRELAMELERTRGALDERDLQLRRLERYANSSAQVLSRIKNGIERGEPSRRVQTNTAPESGATLVPLNDSNAPPVVLGRHTTIGRAAESDICLKDTSVSRRHAVLTIGPNGAFIEDLRSVNGVKLNRQRVRHARLADGDVIEFGAKLFRFTAPTAKSAETG
jgi:chromosome segregation ATPase